MHSKQVINPELLNAHAHDAKLVLSFATLRKNIETKRSIKITDHLLFTFTNVIYCITCTLCKKLYIGETGRQPGDRFREHLRDVEKDDKTHLNRSRDTLIFPIILNNIWQSAAFPYFKEARKAVKLRLEQKCSFQIGTLNPHGINERFSFN